MARFIRNSKVRFEDCDIAGIVFYPQYILMLSRLVEDWFFEALGLPMSIMHHERKLGFPTVNLQVDFIKVSRLDEVLEWSLEVRRLGARSATLGVSACRHGEQRVKIEITIVSVNLATQDISSRDIPADIRAGMEAYLVAP
jgi:4-hydroxybenzoyl-CoA thioesterase